MSKNSLRWGGGTRTPKPKKERIYSLSSQPIALHPIVAEDVGFEPTVPCGTLVFKTSAFDHSANLPSGASRRTRTADHLITNQKLYQLSY